VGNGRSRGKVKVGRVIMRTVGQQPMRPERRRSSGPTNVSSARFVAETQIFAMAQAAGRRGLNSSAWPKLTSLLNVSKREELT
jgi:hypothetical protein